MVVTVSQTKPLHSKEVAKPRDIPSLFAKQSFSTETTINGIHILTYFPFGPGIDLSRFTVDLFRKAVSWSPRAIEIINVVDDKILTPAYLYTIMANMVITQIGMGLAMPFVTTMRWLLF